ncbi:hypothetical protein EMIHUDRAFT_95628 [Emiliania huxleyi CCMP1516]|uniref:Uncharacterized protein n=2 Tax=Emiliania huxleyi TaxID=2903 RepID=A0A0D3JHQ1_EMIH1|nr:hypothetical protein EMIHUDRAFT_95628 [Emiliania huxleyi CCMP1516]EOD23036.1 hypothetical protein EMIHUDRAFT_95628 [Emiliania huxleyi CCMP1516]|eukprot:XP_005775465.1 hypothetical protein EMIHUDRAFT_95628 [Emiliania huxleyi CCMP1516]
MWERAVPEEDKHNQKRKRMPATPPVPEEALVLELGATLEELQAAAAAEQEDGADAMGVALAAANEADAQVLLAEEAVERALDELAKATDEAATLRAEAERVAGKMIASAAAHAAAAAAITVSVGDDPHPGFRAKYGAQAPEREGKNRAVPQSAANRTPKAATPRHGSWDKIQSPTTGKAQTRSRSGGAGRPEQPIRAAKAGGRVFGRAGGRACAHAHGQASAGRTPAQASPGGKKPEVVGLGPASTVVRAAAKAAARAGGRRPGRRPGAQGGSQGQGGSGLQEGDGVQHR